MIRYQRPERSKITPSPLTCSWEISSPVRSRANVLPTYTLLFCKEEIDNYRNQIPYSHLPYLDHASVKVVLRRRGLGAERRTGGRLDVLRKKIDIPTVSRELPYS